MVRAIMEGVTYSLRDCLEIIEEQGVAVKQIRATGGGAQSAFWRQMQADVLGKTVVSMAADEGPAYGVALLAAVGAGEFNEHRRSVRRDRENHRPDEAERRGAQALRQGVSDLSAAVSIAARRFSRDCGNRIIDERNRATMPAARNAARRSGSVGYDFDI